MKKDILISTTLKKEFLQLIADDNLIFDLIQTEGPDGLIFCDHHSGDQWIDLNLRQTLGYEEDSDLYTQNLREQKEINYEIQEAWNQINSDHKNIKRNISLKNIKGKRKFFLCHIKLIENKNKSKMLLLFKEDLSISQSDHKKELQKTRHQAAMQELLISIFAKYINLPLEDVEISINDSLKELGEFVAVDRAYVFNYNFNKNICDNTYEWCAEGIDPQIENSKNLPLDAMPPLVNAHKKGDPFYVPEVKLMPHYGLKNILEEQNILSLLTVPMMENGYPIGFVGFDSVSRYRSYSEQEIGLLKLFAEMLVNIRIRTQKQMETQHLLNTTTDQNKRFMDFSYITSHNIRSSVANIIGLTDILNHELNDNEHIKMLQHTTHKLDEALRNISELLNFENEFNSNNKIECNLSETLNRVLALHNQIIKKENIAVKLNVDDKIVINAIPAFLDSILHNLFTNALKYGVTDHSKIIEISAKPVTDAVEIIIKDYGLGIDLDKYGADLFKIGSRFHAEKGNGQGLGLFMTQHQIKAMDGSITLDSELGVGTTFKIRL
ncbi:MAG: GAF domain-containing sensor histidine kinase [Candidatus Cyclobacteriaceae bacterium M2_1C_046]